MSTQLHLYKASVSDFKLISCRVSNFYASKSAFLKMLSFQNQAPFLFDHDEPWEVGRGGGERE